MNTGGRSNKLSLIEKLSSDYYVENAWTM